MNYRNVRHRTFAMISLTNRCNKECEYCIVKPWLNNPKFPDAIIPEKLISFILEKLTPGDMVELTGGEPTSLTWINSVIQACAEKKVYTLLRTNGFKLDEIIRTPFLVVAYNPHNDAINSHPFLIETDYLFHPTLINPVIETTECGVANKSKDNILIQSDRGTINYPSHPFQTMIFITADGKIRPMTCSEVEWGNVNEYEKLDYGDIFCICPYCKFALCAWNLCARLMYNEKEKKQFKCIGVV